MKRNKSYKKCYFFKSILIAIFFIPGMTAVYAQNADTIAIAKQFMEICNSYKQLPMHVKLLVHNSADIITDGREDTVTFEMEFFVQGNGAYIKMAGQEEVVNDSLVLLINNTPKRMMLFSNTGNITTSINRVAGAFMKDSSLELFNRKYKVVPALESNEKPAVPAIAAIEMATRETVPGSSMPMETIEARYTEKTKKLIEVVQVRHKIIPIDSSTFAVLQRDPGYAGKLVHLGQRYWFLIKSLSTNYLFKEIDYDKHTPLPLRVSDCVVKMQSGHFSTAKGYELFQLTENL